VYVARDGPRLARLAELLGAGTIGVAVSVRFPLEHAAGALAQLQQGTNGQAVVLQLGPAG
jgi:NADPH:quinone reductase-like Zn-dependent oxidoreductase